MVFLRCPRCCSHRLNERCLKLPIDEEDYYVLLRDVTFVESVTMFSSAMFKLLYTVATVAIIVCLIVAGMVSGSCSSDSERFCLDLLSDLTALKVGLASTGVALWLLAYRMLALLRRPYIHMGCFLVVVHAVESINSGATHLSSCAWLYRTLWSSSRWCPHCVQRSWSRGSMTSLLRYTAVMRTRTHNGSYGAPSAIAATVTGGTSIM